MNLAVRREKERKGDIMAGENIVAKRKRCSASGM